MGNRIIPGRPAGRPDWKKLEPKVQRAREQPAQQPHLEVCNLGAFPLVREPAVVFDFRFPFSGDVTNAQIYVDDLPAGSKAIAQLSYEGQTMSLPLHVGSNLFGDAPLRVEAMSLAQVHMSALSDETVWAKGIMISFLYYPQVSP